MCKNEYASYRSMRQHMRLAHPDDYNADLESEVEDRTRKGRWTTGELQEMARLELEYEGDSILDFLASALNRPKEGVRKKRYAQEYADVVEQLRTLRERELVSLIPDIGDPADADLTAASGSAAVDGDLTGHIEPSEGVELIDDPVLLHILALCSQLSHDQDAIATCQAVCMRIEGHERVFDEWVEKICGLYGRTPSTRTRAGPVKPIRQESGRRYRAQLYKYMQSKYTHQKRELADELIDGEDSNNGDIRPTTEAIKEHFEGIFSSESPRDDTPVRDFAPSPCDIYSPISSPEIADSIKKMGKTTGGPDGIDSTRLSRIPIVTLELLANLVLFSQYIPKPLRRSRTILIPKSNENLELAGNWRPITITSILIRLVNRIIAQRLSNSITLDECQRGFTRLDGCFANNITMQSIIKERRKQGRPFTILSLDVQKAFDRVSHHSIDRALRRFRVDKNTANYIMATFFEQTTTIYCGGVEVVTLSLRRGVKQGDPLAPIIFNMVLDELISGLRIRKGIGFGDLNISVLGYADDLLLLSENNKDAQFLLRLTCEFMESRSLTLNPAKCRSISMAVVPSKKKLYLQTTSKFYISSAPIPAIKSVKDTYRYLGYHFTNSGATPCSIASLDAQLGRIHGAPLKPQQKMTLIREHLVPRYIFSLQSPSVGLGVLKKADQLIRRTVKKILKMPTHIVDEALYTPAKLGGIGLFSFTRKIPIIMNGRLRKVKLRSPLFASLIRNTEYWENKMSRMMGSQLNTKEAVDRANAIKLEESFYGGGTQQTSNDSASSAFISSPPASWTGEDYVRAIKLRTNCLPTRGLPYGPREERMCRAGCGRVESLSHVLQKCPLGHTKRIIRHNYIVRRICRMARGKGWEVSEEPHIRDSRGVLNKPDMVCVKNNIVIIADVGVSWEAPRSLSESYLCKKAVYEQPEFLTIMEQRYPGNDIKVLPFIIGARGIWCRESSCLLEELSINTPNNRRELVSTTMRGSWSIHSDVVRRYWS